MPPSVRFVAWAFFLLNLGAVVWPGLTYFNRVEPMILGLPFIMVWLAGWVVTSIGVLVWIEHRLHGLTSGPTSRPPSGGENT
jgi:hypothetical protein